MLDGQKFWRQFPTFRLGLQKCCVILRMIFGIPLRLTDLDSHRFQFLKTEVYVSHCFYLKAKMMQTGSVGSCFCADFAGRIVNEIADRSSERGVLQQSLYHMLTEFSHDQIVECCDREKSETER